MGPYDLARNLIPDGEDSMMDSTFSTASEQTPHAKSLRGAVLGRQLGALPGLSKMRVGHNARDEGRARQPSRDSVHNPLLDTPDREGLALASRTVQQPASRGKAGLDSLTTTYPVNTSKTGQLDESLISAQQPPFRVDSISLDQTEDEDQIMQGRDQEVSRIDRLPHQGNAPDLVDDPAKDFKAEWEALIDTFDNINTKGQTIHRLPPNRACTECQAVSSTGKAKCFVVLPADFDERAFEIPDRSCIDCHRRGNPDGCSFLEWEGDTMATERQDRTQDDTLQLASAYQQDPRRRR